MKNEIQELSRAGAPVHPCRHGPLWADFLRQRGRLQHPYCLRRDQHDDICGIAPTASITTTLASGRRHTADILLEGADFSKMPVRFDPSPALTVNTSVADEIGFKIPESVLAKVTGDSTLEVTRVDSAIVSSGGNFTVGILQLVQHVALDDSNRGVQDQLSVRMAAAGKTVTILDENAAGEQANNITIAETFVSKKVDLIYTIATSSSQAAAAATEEIPVVFCAVTDPVDAGLVASMDNPGGNVTGVSDINPVADQIDLIAELLGKEDITIGLLYTSAETNSEFQIRLAKQHCEAKGYTYVVKGINDLNDIQNAFIALKDVDAIYIPTDTPAARQLSIR